MNKKRAGLALTGSFCTFDKALAAAEELCGDFEVFPIMSGAAAGTDTRFGRAGDFIEALERITGHGVISTVEEAEPIGPKKLFDVMAIAPCTGNTLGKLANGVNDTAVTMAAKAHLRNGRPLVLAVSTNDALYTSAESIGRLLARRDVYFVPMRQDDPEKKPRSVVADFGLLRATMEAAMESRQLQPILL